MTYPPAADPYPSPGQPEQPYGQQQPYGQPQQPYGQPPAAYGQPQQQPYGQPAPAYASWGARVGSYLIDGLVILPFYGLAFFVGMGKDDAGLPTINAFYYIALLLGVVVSGYNRWFQAGKTGQSWGRKAIGLKLIGEQTGQPIGAGQAFVRDLAHVLDQIPCLIGFLFPLWDAKKQTFADKICKTIVVR